MSTAPSTTRLARLADYAAQLNRVATESDVWAVVARCATGMSDADCVLGALHEPGDPLFTVQAIAGAGATLAGARIPFECTAVEESIAGSRTVLVEDLHHTTCRCAPGLVQAGLASAIVTPLLDEGRAFGALVLGYTTARRFSSDDAAAASDIGAVLAATLSRVRMLAQVRQALDTTNQQAARLQEMSDALATMNLELREREARYRLLAENTSDLICEIDASGRRLFVSQSYRNGLGLDPASLVGHSVLERVHPEDAARVQAEMERAIATRMGASAVFRDRHASGEWRWFESTGDTFLTAAGELRGVVVSRDITERRRRDEEQFRLAKLESVGVLAGGIAHDFNNVLTAIMGNVSLLKLDPAGADARQTLDDVEAACRRAVDLTRRLLTFATGGAPVKRSSDVGRLVSDSVRFALSGSRVRVECRISPDLWTADLDEGQIAQVFHNLAINAAQAMPAGGSLVVSGQNLADVSAMAFGALEAGPCVRLDFRDDGPGILPEHLPRVFDPYFTTKAAGSGLGLAAAHSVVRAHGGHLTVESAPGQGATFTVILPATPGLQAPLAGPRNQPTGAGRVLLMDDDEQIRRIGLRGLRQAGYEAEAVAGGADAVEAVVRACADGRPYSVVLLDLTIPGGMGGVQALASIRAVAPTLPAVVLSGYSTDPVLAEPVRYGFASHLAKPFTVDDLRAVVADALTRTPGPAGV